MSQFYRIFSLPAMVRRLPGRIFYEKQAERIFKIRKPDREGGEYNKKEEERNSEFEVWGEGNEEINAKGTCSDGNRSWCIRFRGNGGRGGAGQSDSQSPGELHQRRGCLDGAGDGVARCEVLRYGRHVDG